MATVAGSESKTGVDIQERVKELVLEYDPGARYLTINEVKTELTGVRCHTAAFLTTNSNIGKLRILVDINTLEQIAVFASTCAFHCVIK
jgi:hypothetical protein